MEYFLSETSKCKLEKESGLQNNEKDQILLESAYFKIFFFLSIKKPKKLSRASFS